MIRPVDFQMVIPKSQELTQTLNSTNRQEIQQQMFAQQLLKQVEKEKDTVSQAKKGENQTVDKDGSNKNQTEEEKKKEKKKKEEEREKMERLYGKTGLLDIRG
jgi:ribosomal protein L12E/L44/L45/RPP1/RPP2